jgi:hypothetical protein
MRGQHLMLLLLLLLLCRVCRVCYDARCLRGGPDAQTCEATPAGTLEAAVSVDAGAVGGAVVCPSHALIDVHVAVRPLIAAGRSQSTAVDC